MVASTPLTLDELSAVGFGCYRISTAAVHERALNQALMLGCNLFDTAATYSGGRSEEALGKVLRSYAGPSFVISKAGYCEDCSDGREGALGGTETRHSVHPDFLRARIATSTARLGAAPDALLLHNPERLFEGGHLDEDEFYHKIILAFEALEEQVEIGRLRYYGVSSNTLRPSGFPPYVGLDRLVAAARSVSRFPHFRIIQFPFNFYELGATDPIEGNSLLSAAAAAGIRTFGNRPLNAFVNGEVRRIATYDWQISWQGRRVGANAVDALRNVIAWTLQDRLPGVEVGKAPAIQFLSGMWKTCKDPEFVEYILVHHVDPLGELIVTDASRAEFVDLRNAARKALMENALHIMSEEGVDMRKSLIASGQLQIDDRTPLALAACREYLNLGIDHVLVGMRKQAYVNQLQSLFRTTGPRYSSSQLFPPAPALESAANMPSTEHQIDAA